MQSHTAGGGGRKILIVEDEPDIVRGLRDALQFEGFQVEARGTGMEGLDAAAEWGPDCVLLDLMLPDENGYRVCETLRSRDPVVPIIILTAKSQDVDKVRGLEAGADDYVTKPFSVAELIARINAIFRRQVRLASHEEAFDIGPWRINTRKHTMNQGRSTKRLTFYELEVLKLLRERAESPVTRDEILEKIWGVTPSPANRTVDNFIVKLRRKLEEDHKRPRHILTVYGHGYKLVP
ncbi:response regulator transcription factor [Haliangium ochraceum]|uniref:Two component transcriptional regulator, winged helix family n=1 Tax=Haliangium ochraceum (strain DSM 14365 / JCM 11303 / SMP-2) TaxID=502025 RepID=D0LRC8_HALO1|nr:response regulator transcription factor [Haliangium ochraceum]ACY17156.1 two component transcriptional regulator, winged helix family [Haliangium ochraceum DSM 14365]